MTGRLRSVRQAALIVPGLGAPRLRPLYDLWPTPAYAAHSADVRDTVVDGRVLMRERGLGTVEEGAVLADLEILALS